MTSGSLVSTERHAWSSCHPRVTLVIHWVSSSCSPVSVIAVIRSTLRWFEFRERWVDGCKSKLKCTLWFYWIFIKKGVEFESIKIFHLNIIWAYISHTPVTSPPGTADTRGSEQTDQGLLRLSVKWRNGEKPRSEQMGKFRENSGLMFDYLIHTI